MLFVHTSFLTAAAVPSSRFTYLATAPTTWRPFRCTVPSVCRDIAERPHIVSAASNGRTEAQPNDATVSLNIDRLLSFLERMDNAGKKPDDEWLQMMQAATSASAPDMTVEHRARLMMATAHMNLKVATDWIDTMLDFDLSLAGPLELVTLLSSLTALEYPLSFDFLWQSMAQLAARHQQVNASVAAQAISVVVHLGVADLVQAVDASAAAVVSRPDDPEVQEYARDMQDTKRELGMWLDLMIFRMLGEDLAQMDADLLVQACVAVTAACRHTPPFEFAQAVSTAAVRPDLTPEQGCQLAIFLAACKCVPDVVMPSQLYVLTGGCMDQLDIESVSDLMWALATWTVGSDGTPMSRYDLRPPARWWEEWFQVTGNALQKGSLSKLASVRLVWALSILRVRPPEPWTLLLVNHVYKMLQLGQLDPVELLYLSRSADIWYGMMLGLSPTTVPDAPMFRNRSKGNTGSSMRSFTSQQQPLRIVGCEDEYQPPIQLAVLVRDANHLMTRSNMPVGWKRINVRYPPYALPAREDEQRDQNQDQQDRLLTGDSSFDAKAWGQSVAAQRIYGPLMPPAWR